MQFLLSVSLCRALQPFGRALVEAGKAFFGMEQEKTTLRGLLEYEAGKCLDELGQNCMNLVPLYSLLFPGAILLLQPKRLHLRSA